MLVGRLVLPMHGLELGSLGLGDLGFVSEPRFLFSADFSKISPKIENLVTFREMLIPLKKIR
jgi:hypothetical protein